MFPVHVGVGAVLALAPSTPISVHDLAHDFSLLGGQESRLLTWRRLGRSS
jgi:hypothetical protein